MRNSGKALLLQHKGAKTSNRFPCLLLELGKQAWSLKWGEGRGAYGGSSLRGDLGGLSTWVT